ncbi:FtsX-like permease family protein [Aestuariibacter sp. AA17]|uniref:FtsX-like permease family protein n=1 Tax=Fluctibacter corallii TaxID=2984329 RepID=A0ABT3A5I5_9ALTE|nr:FtsX-like permease family protein [Aestuariibacter sp. AA17]MCV2883847.1 FtsX-like permease family protein [Aestuariibacter sp. AA17]
MSTVFNLAWRLFRHEARRGELTIILLAITLSVAAVLSLSLFSERLQSALTAQTAEFLAADRVLDSRQPVNDEWIDKAQSMALNTTHVVHTRSMIFANDNLLLGRMRAVTPGYPLKGEVKISDAPFTQGQVTTEQPQPGEVWAESRVLQSLGAKIGDTLEVGDAQFVLTNVITDVPDAGFNVFGGNPMVMISEQDLAKTNIAGPGSRVTYSYYFTGEEGDLDAYYEWLRPQLDSEIHDWDSVKDSASPLGRSVARAERYFLLASLLAIVLAAVSIAVAAQRYSQRHYDPVAIMKTLGAPGHMVRKIYLLQISFITCLGIILGTIAGLVIQQGVVTLIGDTVDISLGTWHWRPVMIATMTGIVCAVLFSLYPLMKLFSVPPLRVLRRDLGATMSSRLVQFLAAGSAIFMLMYAYSQNVMLSAILFVSGIALVIGLLGITYGLIVLGRKLGSGRIGAWQLAWARIRRRAMGNSVQLISFSITIMLLLVVLVMRNDMVKQWRDQLPEGTPNYFLINITQSQLPPLKQHFADMGVETDTFYPVVRGRFVAINGEGLRTEITKEEESVESDQRRGLGREANLTWSLNLQSENRIVEGKWLTEQQGTEEYGVSVENKVAERLGINMGDTLTFNVGSEQIDVKVTSLREVNWQTMQPNFFFVLHPDVMKNYRPTYITSFHLPASRKAEISQLLQPFSSVTLYDVDAQINQLRDIVDQVSLAVEFILVLVLAAGSLVLIAQVQASMDERQEEIAILRTLGAKGRLIRSSVLVEFLIIGVVAGFMAAIANELTLYLLQKQVFDMEGSFHFVYWLVAPMAGATMVGILGAAGCWRLLRLNTSHLLRQMV